MKRNEDFRNALGQPDEYFRQSVIDTLDQLNMQAEKEKRPQRRYPARLACTFAALVLAITGLSLSGVRIPGIPTESSVDAIRPTPTVATQLTADQLSAAAADQAVSRIPFVETELATLTVRNPKIIGSHIKLQVEVMPKAEKTLALNWSIHPYTDRVTKIGKTPDYAEQSIMQWANDHGYTLLRVVFGNAFEPEIPGVLPDIDPPKTGTIQAPAFDSIFIDQSTYEDSGATVITVSGDTLPDTMDYMLGFVLQTWDNTKTDYRDYENAFRPDNQIFGNIPFRTEAEIIETVALYTSHPHPFKSDSDLEYTAAFYKTTYGEYMEVRTNDLSLTDTFKSYNLYLMSQLSSHQFLVLYDFWATRVYPDSANIDSPLESECYQTEDGWLVVRCPCVISELPDMLDLDVGTSHCNLIKVESGWNNWGEEIDRSTVISTGPENNTLETELADLKLLQAETDDQGLLFSFAVSPRQDHILVIGTDINPEINSPTKIGLTPDRAGQTIAEWALKHGYDQVMAIDLFSPSVEECPTRDAKCRTAIRAAGQDGSAILDVRGSILADKALYDLCCTISVSNLAGHYTYTDDGAGGSGTTFTARYTQDAHTFLKVSVPGGEETPVTRN